MNLGVCFENLYANRFCPMKNMMAVYDSEKYPLQLCCKGCCQIR